MLHAQLTAQEPGHRPAPLKFDRAGYFVSGLGVRRVILLVSAEDWFTLHRTAWLLLSLAKLAEAVTRRFENTGTRQIVPPPVPKAANERQAADLSHHFKASAR